jgi:sugar lactone lactonase YvrE
MASIEYAPAQTIHTFAGNGIPTYGGDGGPATAASLSSTPTGVATDAMGNVYIADGEANLIRKVNTSGIITSIAGRFTGFGFSGDGGPATAAFISGPEAVAVDRTGNVYFTDGGNSRVRKINTAGIITTIAGNGTWSTFSDGFAATAAGILDPIGLVVDTSGNVYISDDNTHRIWKVDTSGIIHTFVGNGRIGYTGDSGPATAAAIGVPRFLAFDRSGNLYFADQYNNVVRKVNTSGVISTVAGNSIAGYAGDGGAATAAELNLPQGVAVDSLGNIYIGDWSNRRVRRVSTSGIISTFAGNGTYGYGGDGGAATAAMLRYPCGVATDRSGNLYIGDVGNSRIRVVMPPTTPVFDSGSKQYLTVCENSIADPINSLLSITDTGIWLTETYSVISAPSDGAITTGSTTTSGTSVSPSGWAYTPTTGYIGTDSFSIEVNNGDNIATTTIYVTVNPLPVAGTISGTTAMCVSGTLTLRDPVPGGVWSTSTTGMAVSGTTASTATIAGVATGAGTVSYSVTNSCGTAIATFTVDVLDVPVVAAITGTTTLCTASSATLTDASGGGVWASTDASVATVASSGAMTATGVGMDSIKYSVTNICGTTTAAIEVTVITTPAAAPITGPGSMCRDSVITLSDAASGGIWASAHTSIATIGSTGIVAAADTGTDTILYTLTNSCGDTTVSMTVSVIDCDTVLGVAGVQPIARLSVYPDPASDELHIDNVQSACNYVLYNAVGAAVRRGTLSIGDNVIGRQQLPAGLYLLGIDGPSGTRMVAKVVYSP